MISDMHKMLQRWARWERLPVGGSRVPSWAPTTLTAKLIDGKGEFLPGAPRGSGPILVPIDLEAMQVDKFISTLPHASKNILKTFYLQPAYTVDEKAEILGMSKKQLYKQLSDIQSQLQYHIESHNPIAPSCAPKVVYVETRNR